MKYCTNCSHSVKEGIQTPQGWQTIVMCSHGECREPVDGSLIPCGVARKEQVFCGIQAKHYKEKEQDKPAGPVIQLK